MKKAKTKVIEATETQYILGDKKYDRVTSVLKIIHSSGLEMLKRQFGPQRFEKMFKSAGDRGTAFHEHAEEIINHGSLNSALSLIIKRENPDMLNMINNFVSWRKAADIKKIIFTEKWFSCDTLGIAGTSDLFYEDSKGKKILVDFKTGSKELKIYRLQLSAYKYLIESNTKHKVDKRIVLQVRPDFIKSFHYKDDKKDFMLYTYALELYREFKNE